jgi:hypothetical protein
VTAVNGSWIMAALAAGFAAAMVTAFRQLRGTTLSAPAVWAAGSALLIALVEAEIARRGQAIDPLTASLGRYAAAASTFCPLMAVLGAKRPQDRGWQWVVLSLWAVLLVPAIQTVAARSGPRLELFPAWRLLIAALIVMGLLNYLPTRYAIPAVLFSIGQTFLVSPYLFNEIDGRTYQKSGLAALIAAVTAASIISSRWKLAPRASEDERAPLRQLNLRWFAFRDGWGAFWGLRVLQRVNQTAELSGWPVQLEWWNGFVPAPDNSSKGSDDSLLNAQTAAHIQQTLDSLLRRFERM